MAPQGHDPHTAGGMSLWCGDLGTRSSIDTRLGVQTLDPELLPTEIQTTKWVGARISCSAPLVDTL